MVALRRFMICRCMVPKSANWSFLEGSVRIMKDWKSPELTGSENMRERQESKSWRPMVSTGASLRRYKISPVVR